MAASSPKKTPLPSLGPWIWFFLAVFFLSPFRVDSQSTDFKSLTVQDGLSCSNVNAIVQDGEGFIWIGTFDGLNRYDGYEFTVYRNLKGDPSSISANAIQDLFVDAQKRLWIGTQSGLDLYDRRGDRFRHFRNADGNGNDISDVTQLADGEIVFCSSTGLFKVGIENSVVSPFLAGLKDAQGGRPSGFKRVLADRRSRLWIGTANQGALRRRFEKRKILRLQRRPEGGFGTGI